VSRRLLTLGLAALAALAIAAPAAQAHAQLEGTSPAAGAVVGHEPSSVTFRFGEAVEGNFGAVSVYDAAGRHVDDGKPFHPGGDGKKIAVALKSDLPKGSYTATYRVISADSHPVSGGLVFSIGAAGAAPGKSVADLLAGESVGPVTQTAFGIARGMTYLAIALGLGGLVFLMAIWGPALAASAGAGAEWPAAAAAFARRARVLLALAVGLGFVFGLAGIVLQGATASGTTFWAALDPGVVREVLGTRFGLVWALRCSAWLLLGAVLVAGAGTRSVAVLRPVAVGADGYAPSPAPSGATIAALAVPVAFLAISPALAGHASTEHPVAALAPLDLAHVLAMSAWIGGLVMALLVVPAATRRLVPADRSRLLAALLLRFSPLALACVVALAVTGSTMALLEMGGVSPLLHTAFGRAVLIKIVLLLALVVLGAVNRLRVVPALARLASEGAAPGAAGRLLRRTLRAEVALVVAVLGVTAALVSYAPPSTAAAGPFSATQRMGPIELQTTIDPARVGANALHLYLFDAGTGAPYTKTRELDVEATLPDKRIGPLRATMHRGGPGHYVADALTLQPGGDWKLTVTDRVSDFDSYTATVKVPVR
jgi:copper transport protein